MLKIARKKAFTLFALTLLVTSVLFASLNIPASGQLPDSMHLDGPSLKPIHMHSNITLTPIHMHHTNGILWPGVYPITQPNCTTDWRKLDLGLDPFDFEWWHLSSWEDNGENFGELSQNDQIDMYNWDDPSIVEWFHVDRMTLTLYLSGPYPDPTHTPGEVRSIMEMKQPYCNPYDPYVVYDPLGTLWTQVWPIQYVHTDQLTIWIDDPLNINGMLDFTDSISFDQGLTWWHVEDIATDLILRWKMMDPIGTYWHELYPDYCEWYEMTSWSSFPDPYCDRISSRDTIDMLRLSDTSTHWYFVDRVTITINVTDEQTLDWMMLELKTLYYEEMFHAFKKPLGTLWHAVYPEDVYCTVFNLTFWDPLDPDSDNCNGVLDPCDYIILENIDSGGTSLYHITDMAYDIILNEYITDPVGSAWNELYPDGTLAEYTIIDFTDNGDLWLSPCDNVTLSDPTGLPAEYHVENVTLTLNITILDTFGSTPFTIDDRVYLEHIQAAWNYSWPRLYHPKIEPWDTDWLVVNPPQYYKTIYTFDEWFDNCNGVIDYCDTVYLYNVDGGFVAHVDEVAVDIVVEKIAEEPPPPPPWYKKPPYPDYAPSGVPDFDQKQDAWGPAQGVWTWCGPVAVGNSLWWFDSKYDPSDIVTAYAGIPDDHHVLNVDPFIRDLSWWMDTDDQRSPFDGHTGTFWQDMVYGIDQYLQQQRENDTLEVHFLEFPSFPWIEEEVERCQDVVLLLEFWIEVEPGVWLRVDPYDFPGGDGGHYVTCAGVNSTTSELLFCDPFFDAAEAGWPGDVPVAHPGHADPTVHNDTQYVSHDAYFIVPWIEPPVSPYPGVPIWEVLGYLPQNMGLPPNYHTFIRVAVATSPLAEHDVAVTGVTHSKAGCVPFPTAFPPYPMNVTVDVENQGGFTETFNVTAYYDGTSIGNQSTTLNPGENTTLTFTWDTTGVAYGNYTLSATAHLPGDSDPGDNTFIDGWIIVTKPGDIDGNGAVNILDAIRLAAAFGSKPGDPTWNPNADIRPDGEVNILDAIILAANFG